MYTLCDPLWYCIQVMMTSSNGNIFRVTGPLCEEFTGMANSLHKGQLHEALMFSLICVWINGYVHNCEASDLRRHRAHYDVTAIWWHLQDIPRIMHTFRVLLYLLWICIGQPSSISSGIISLVLEPMKQTWTQWLNTMNEILCTENITAIIQTTAKPCACFMQ